jgi:hypothetical protein
MSTIDISSIEAAKFKAAHQAILQEHIEREYEKQQSLELHLSRVSELAVARYQSKNTLGAIMSMRKYYKWLMEYERQTALITALQQLNLDISNEVLSNDSFLTALKSLLVLDHSDSTSTTSMTDSMLLGELSTITFMKRVLRKRDQSLIKSSSITNAAA